MTHSPFLQLDLEAKAPRGIGSEESFLKHILHQECLLKVFTPLKFFTLNLEQVRTLTRLFNPHEWALIETLNFL